MRTLSTLLAAGALALTGCGKKDDKPAAAPASGGNPLTAPVDYLGAVSKAKIRSEQQIELISVNQAIRQFHSLEGRFPKSLKELVEKGYLPREPAPPRGTRFLYHAERGEVELIRE